MGVSIETIMSDMNALAERVRNTDVEQLDYTDRVILSNELAYLTYEIRRKYKLYSDVYIVAEDKAAKRYARKYGEEI